MPGIAGALKPAAKFALHYAGGLQLMRWVHRDKLRILMYHRFADRETLARQCAYLREHYQLVSMKAVAEWLHAGGGLPHHAAAVTVDDGYGDFQEVAWPVFAEYGIPATVYLISGFLDDTLWLWYDKIRYAFDHAGIGAATVEMPDGGAIECSLDSEGGRRAGAEQVIARAEALSRAEQREFVAKLPAVLQAEVPESVPAEYKPLTWDQARSLAAAGVEFGAHTRTHPILSRVSDAEELREEIAGSKARIESELQRPVMHFCYPNGKMQDISPAAVEAVRAAGMRTAVTAEPGLNGAQADAWLLHRTPVDPGYEAGYFRQLLAGVG